MVLMESDEKVEWMNNILWVYDPNSFLPHGSEKDENPESQPIYLTAKFKNPNQANLAVVTDGSEIEQYGSFNRIIDIFDGTDTALTAKARERWKKYKALGLNLEYRQQTESGSWKT